MDLLASQYRRMDLAGEACALVLSFKKKSNNSACQADLVEKAAKSRHSNSFVVFFLTSSFFVN